MTFRRKLNTGLMAAAVVAFVPLADIGSDVLMAQTDENKPNWITMSDGEFCRKFYREATSKRQQQRSRFAWRLFARLSQQTVWPPTGPNQQTFAAWEVWPSDANTFPPQFKPTRRLGPQLKRAAKVAVDAPGGQEVTRNPLAYDFIANQRLYRKSAATNVLGRPTQNGSPRIDFPVGSMETKAQWMTLDDWNQLLASRGLAPVRVFPADMYTIQGDSGMLYGLVGLHIMAKIKDYPDGPRTIDDPSWFWATFEYYNNPDRKYLVDFVTYKDTMTHQQQQKLLAAAGLDNTKFAITVDVPIFNSETGEITTVKGNNYLSNGSQYRFVGPDPETKRDVNVVLGNSVIEAAFVIPAPPGRKNPFRGFNTSCHSCHFEASGNSRVLTQSFHSVTGYISLGKDADGNQLYPIDFEWSIPLLAQPDTN